MTGIVISLVLIILVTCVGTYIAYRRRRRDVTKPATDKVVKPELKPLSDVIQPANDTVTQPEPQLTLEVTPPATDTVARPEPQPPLEVTQPATDMVGQPKRKLHLPVTNKVAQREPKPLPKNRGTVEAIGHGGGSRKPRPKPDKETLSRIIEKPEIICWKRERTWVLSVELPESVLERPSLSVRQNDKDLRKDELRNDSWQLINTKEIVTVSWGEDEEQSHYDLETGMNNYILFKLNASNRGCNVRTYSYGQYLAIVPNGWRRDENVSGSPPATPEPVSVDGYQAHFFFIEKGTKSKIAFFLPNGISYLIRPNNYEIELIGKSIEDAGEGMGRLFIDEPPKIHFLSMQALKQIKKVVVGEEGSNRSKWRAQLNVAEDDGENQSLAPALVERGMGWFFLRFYDEKDDLVDSLDFRFIPSMRNIRIVQCPTPSENGHMPVTVEFDHDTRCKVQPIENSESCFELRRESEKTIIVIPPDPKYDKTLWLISTVVASSTVRVDVLVERFWWCLSEESKQEKNWQANLIPLDLNDFRAISKRSFIFKLPRARWTDAVMIGFTRDSVKKYEVMVKEDRIVIPLRHFGDDQALRNIGKQRIRAWVKHQDDCYEVAIGELSVSLSCGFCDFDAPDEEIILDHVRSEHMNENFTSLTYEELCRLKPDLPDHIYVCRDCGYFNRSDECNCTSDMTHHYDHCPQKPPGKGAGFHIVTDIKEIEQTLKINLPRIHRCMHCQELIEDNGEEKLFDHLVQKHDSSIYRLC